MARIHSPEKAMAEIRRRVENAAAGFKYGDPALYKAVRITLTQALVDGLMPYPAEFIDNLNVRIHFFSRTKLINVEVALETD